MNRSKKWLSKEQKVSDVLINYTYQCKKCGRKELIRYNENNTLCTHCGNLIFKKDIDEYKYRMEKLMK